MTALDYRKNAIALQMKRDAEEIVEEYKIPPHVQKLFCEAVYVAAKAALDKLTKEKHFFKKAYQLPKKSSFTRTRRQTQRR